MILHLALVVLFALGDAACVLWLAQATPSDAAARLGGHALLAGGAALSVMLVAPAMPPRERRAFFALAFAVAMFVPGLGPLGLAAALVFGVRAARRAGDAPWRLLELERDIDQIHPGSVKRRVSAPAIADALQDRAPARAEWRFQAVLQTRLLAPRVAVPLLKRALKDPSDEVRLFAFARLERLRDALETEMKQLKAALEDATDAPVRARTHLRLAEANWEIAYLALAEGAVLEHALAEARLHASEACKFPRRGNGPAEFLLGRILLMLRRHGDALAAFERAERAGHSRLRVLPYLAECAFLARRFEDVRARLGELGASNPPFYLRHLLEFWR